MNDRYLYRAKRTDNGEWIIGNLVYSENASIGYEYMIMPTQIIGNWSTVLKDTICQCTGLKDKNGKLIWENEIIKCKCGIAVVVWDKSEWRIKWGKDNIWRKDLHFWVNDENEYGVEVIGNIFDNPELLEVGQ